MDWSCFLTYSEIIVAFRPWVFKVIIDTVEVIFTINCYLFFALILCCYFCLPLFAAFFCFLNKNTIDLQCCANFCCKVTQSYIYVCVYIFTHVYIFFLFTYLFLSFCHFLGRSCSIWRLPG